MTPDATATDVAPTGQAAMPATDTPSVPTGAGVELRSLSRQFGATLALDRFSLTIAPGELVALLGPSGCGKTTALRVLAGFERPDQGQVLVGGRDVTRLPAQKRDMGMVFQSYSLFPNMDARANVGFGLRMRRWSGAKRKARADELLELVGLAEHRTKYPHQLSGGQQQRVALARALAIEPQVLLLDEPLSALDAKVRAELREQIRAIQQRLLITTVFVTHDQEEALSMADRVCVMRAGRIEQVDVPAALYARPTTAFVAQFVGVSSRIEASFDAGQPVILGQRCTARPGSASRETSARLDALLRPEDLTVTPDHDGEATVVHSSFLGGTTRLDVLLGATVLKIDVRSDVAARLSPSTRVRVGLHNDEVLLVEHLEPEGR